VTYQVVVPKPVQKQLDKLPEKEYQRIIEKILVLKENPRPPGCTKLTGHKNEYRIRIGSYRVRYEVDDDKLMVVLLHCLHRKDIYRR